MDHELNDARAVRAAFWRENPRASRRLVRNHAGTGTMHVTDTRVAFCDWLDGAARDGRVSQSLANNVTLKG